MRLAGVRSVSLGLSLLALASCRERAAKLMRVDSSAPAAPTTPLEEPNQVHFSFSSPTSITFDWRGSGRTLRVWSKDMAPREIASHEPTPKPYSSPGQWREATVTDLSPGTEYGYEIGRPRQPYPSFVRTPPVPGPTAFSFVAVAGMGASMDALEVMDTHRLIKQLEPAFVLGLGDLTLGDVRSQASVDRHFEDIMVWSRRAAYMPVWGEHEWRTPARDDLRNYKGRFALPNAQTSPGAPPAGCCGEDWYWFDYANVRFIAYPEPYTDETWQDWGTKAAPVFAAAEADPKLTFIVTMGHQLAYSSGTTAGDARLRKLLDGFGARFGKYVLNVSGHSHAYERTKPQAHVVHISTSAPTGELEHAATPCSWPECKAPPFTAFRAIHHGFLRFSVQERSIKADAVCVASVSGRDEIRCIDGDIFDTVRIEAQPAKAVAGTR
jgi:hypothetical protein